MTVKKLIQADKTVKGARILVLGLTFKENVPDIRNTRVIDIIAELREYGVEVLVHDPVAYAEEARAEYGIDLIDIEAAGNVDGVVFAVAHRAFASIGPAGVRDLCTNGGQGVVIDVKTLLNRKDVEAEGLLYWSL
jgi:UDP-N-acetyl-D-galactosamine dehydrogenase